MRYRIHVHAKLDGDFDAIPLSTQKRIREAIRNLADDPRPMGAIKMAGFRNAYRIRVGDYRVGYQVFDHELIVVVIVAAERGKIYPLIKRRLKK